ncbi:lytic transglycosylase domain-containing protein [bacterium]|nr:lytic transglycosylase domain-containing protein [bacterium]MBU1754425.1 lytic transglycosylase domain-containing protein [bacterium]
MKNIIRSIFNSLVLGLIVLCAVFILLANSNWFWDIISPVFYKELIYKYSTIQELDPLLISAVIKVESNFQPYAKSPRGAIGLMQIMPETGKEMAKRLKIEPFVAADLNNPEINLQIGLYYLARLKKQFNGDLYLVLAAYNGGSANVQKWLDEKKIDDSSLAGQRDGDKFIAQIPFEETRGFVKKVLWNYKWFKNVQRVKNTLQFKQNNQA